MGSGHTSAECLEPWLISGLTGKAFYAQARLFEQGCICTNHAQDLSCPDVERLIWRQEAMMMSILNKLMSYIPLAFIHHNTTTNAM